MALIGGADQSARAKRRTLIQARPVRVTVKACTLQLPLVLTTSGLQ